MRLTKGVPGVVVPHALGPLGPCAASDAAPRSKKRLLIAEVDIPKVRREVRREVRRHDAVRQVIEERFWWERPRDVAILARQVVLKCSALLPPSKRQLDADQHDSGGGGQGADIGQRHAMSVARASDGAAAA